MKKRVTDKNRLWLFISLLGLVACSSSQTQNVTNEEDSIKAQEAETAETANTEPEATVMETLLTPTEEIEVPAGYQAFTFVEGLTGPTQMIIGPDGWLWVALLAGAEGGSTGKVIAISMATGEQRTLVEGLNTPTGIAVLDNTLWIAEQRNLLRVSIVDEKTSGEVETVLEALPYNGRSNGTLTVTPDHHLLYITSGIPAESEDLSGSGILWQLDPANPTQSKALAIGLKNAYAHVFDENGRLWITEVADETVDGKAPVDELNLVVPDAHFGWPQCYGEQIPVTNFGGTPEFCTTTRMPVVTFPPHTTPTSVAISPWEADTLFVALWVAGEVVRVPVIYEGDNATGTMEPFIEGLQNPQHLLELEDGSLLVSDFSNGTIYKIVKVE